jgi:hypothetical protein
MPCKGNASKKINHQFRACFRTPFIPQPGRGFGNPKQDANNKALLLSKGRSYTQQLEPQPSLGFVLAC